MNMGLGHIKLTSQVAMHAFPVTLVDHVYLYKAPKGKVASWPFFKGKETGTVKRIKYMASSTNRTYMHWGVHAPR